MSEYQYYEFQAIDRPLTKTELAELRALSTRAQISSTRFQNFYTYGDFKGEPLALMERYFDAFLYVANWGTHWFMLRLPGRALDLALARRYCMEEGAMYHVHEDHMILEFRSEDEEGSGWVEDEEAEGWLPALLPLRSELLRGDLRGLYLAWLACVTAGEVDDETVEPPLPAGLGSLSASLEAMVEFLRVDEDLLDVAAERSPALQSGPPSGELEGWIRALPESEKNSILLRLVRGEDLPLQADLLRRFDAATGHGSVGVGERTVGELLSQAGERAERRQREEAERQAAEQARREQEQAAARSAYLDRLAGREEDVWRQIDALIDTKQPKPYDQAVQLLRDLHDLSVRRQQSDAFAGRLGALRDRYVKRYSLIERFDRAGLKA